MINHLIWITISWFWREIWAGLLIIMLGLHTFLYINFTDIWMCWCVFNTRYSSVSTDPVQTGLIHALRLLLELEVLAVHTQTLDVCRQVRHVGHPGHRTLGRGRGSSESGRRLWALKHTDTENMRTHPQTTIWDYMHSYTTLSIMKDGGCVLAEIHLSSKILCSTTVFNIGNNQKCFILLWFLKTAVMMIKIQLGSQK